MTKDYALLKISGHQYESCGHHHTRVSAAVDCIIDRGCECGSYVVATQPFARDRELNADEDILFYLALHRRYSLRIDEALRRLEKVVA